MRFADSASLLFMQMKKNQNNPQADSAQERNTLGRYSDHWRKLLSRRRVSNELDPRPKGDTDQERQFDNRSPFERDYERVLFSSAFRRLAGKTQVRSFPDVDFIHTRLTHSIEVAAVARTLGLEVGRYLLSQGDIHKRNLDSICWICQAAGLGHDLGNPPYGHAGEYAIQYWASRMEKSRRIFPEHDVWKDIESYDGNAQAFRILCTHDTRAMESFSFTAASAGALVKYPRLAAQCLQSSGEKKYDVFSNADPVFKATWDVLGLSVAKTQRHPLSYLVEAADDICYRVVDFEDAAISGVIAPSRIVSIMRECLDKKDGNIENAPLTKLRSRIIRKLILDFVQCFKVHYCEIMEGTIDADGDLCKYLPANSTAKKYFGKVDEVYVELYTERNKVIRECGAYSQIPALLNRGYEFVREAFQKNSNGENLLPEFKRLSHFSQEFITLAWEKDFYEQNRPRSFEWWMHMLLDYVVGMTDSYINMLSQKLI